MQDFPRYKGKGGLTQNAMKRLVVGARCAIKMHSNTGNVQQLNRADLRNGPNHVFNDHAHRSSTFCKVSAQTTQTNQVQWANSNDDSDTLDEILSEELQQEVQAHNEEDEARGANSTYDRKNIPDDLFFRIQRAGDRLVSIWLHS